MDELKVKHRTLHACGAALLVLLAHGSSLAQTETGKSAWEVSLGVGLASAPAHEGSAERVSSAVPMLELSYKTRDYGVFSVSGKEGGLVWTPLQTERYSLGFVVGSDPGRRDDRKRSAWEPGSARLLGMGRIKPSTELGMVGTLDLGVKLQVRLSKGLGKGADVETGNPSVGLPSLGKRGPDIDGHGGTKLELAMPLSLPLAASWRLDVSPSVAWANTAYMRTFFGVSSRQSNASGLRAFKADGGLHRVGLDVSLSYAVDKNWSAVAALSASSLAAPVAKSPVVETRGSRTALLGVMYQF